jgi:uncharacterized protein YkwD
MASRDPKNLTDRMQVLYNLFKMKMDAAGIGFVLTCTSRTVKEQMALYQQGRDTLANVNAMRAMAGLYLLKADAENIKVTWTLHSKHLVDLDNGTTTDDKANAFDIAITRGGIATWDLKVNVNKNEIPDYEEAARIGESVGLKAGARFPSPDWPHFEDPLAKVTL